MKKIFDLLIKLKSIIFKTDIIVKNGVVSDKKLSYKIEKDGIVNELYFSSKQISFKKNDASIPTLLVLLQGMKQKRNIIVNGEVSDSFINNINKYVSIFTDWHEKYHEITLINYGISNVNDCSEDSFTATFFSGGVDSFYTFLKNKNSITQLIFVHGFDVSLKEINLKQRISLIGQKIATDFNVEYIEIETNARQITKGFGHWGLHAHGLGLGAVARSLSGNIGKIFIPSSFSKDELFPWGSHPDLDYLMGDDSIEIVHDGINVTRTEKIEYISQFPEALKYLRVCYKNPNQTYNCCECEKCLRTMTSLYAVGKLSKSTSFSEEIDLEKIMILDLSSEVRKTFAYDNLKLLEKYKLEETSLYKAWKKNLERTQ